MKKRVLILLSLLSTTWIVGYSDNEDVGPGFEPKRQLYDWGRNLARDKPYTANRLSTADSSNADRAGRELTNGAVIAPTDITTNSMVQTATAFWAAGDPVQFVVDLVSRRRWPAPASAHISPTPTIAIPGGLT